MFDQFSTFGVFMPRGLVYFVFIIIVMLFIYWMFKPLYAPKPVATIMVSQVKVQQPQRESFTTATPTNYVPANVNDKYTIDVDEALKEASFTRPEMRVMKTNELVATATLDNSKNIADIYLGMYKPQFIPMDHNSPDGVAPYSSPDLYDINQIGQTSVTHEDSYPSYADLEPMYDVNATTVSPLVTEIIAFDTSMRNDYQKQMDKNQAAKDAKASLQ